MKVSRFLLLLMSAVLLTVVCGAQQTSKAKPDVTFFFATTTTIAVTSEGIAVSDVSQASTVELTATVRSSFGLVTQGQVHFCDANKPTCTDINLVGTGQLTSSGTATTRLVPRIGPHSFYAVFAGEGDFLGSASAFSNLSVSGVNPTSIAINQSGPVGNYSVTTTISNIGGIDQIAGFADFVDTSNQNTQVSNVPFVELPAALNWQNTESILTGSSPRSPVLVDLNGDGRPDLLYSSGSNIVPTLFGFDNGTFEGGAITEDGNPVALSEPTALTIADFDGDGVADLSINSYGSNMLSVYRGSGLNDGGFNWIANYQTGYSPLATVTADFNRDGIADLAVLNTCGNDDCASNKGSVSIFIGAGNGTFSLLSTSPATGGLPESMVVADFNGDGIPDLAIANSEEGVGSTVNSTNTLTILIGKGDGTFNSAPSPVTGQGFPVVAVADFNLDGKPDLAVTDEFDSAVTILMGNGDGTFTPGKALTTGVLPEYVAVGDFNGDGVPDLAVSNGIDNTVMIYLGKGDGTFAAQATTIATDVQPYSMAVGDFNGDGVSDLVVTTYQGQTLEILLSQLTQSSVATATGISFPLNSGTHNVEARFAGNGLGNFGASVSPTVQLKAQATSTVTWTTPAPITYGTALSATQLDATTSVPGTFAYTPALGTVLNAGSQTLSTTFTPTDLAAFTSATATVTLQVNKATPVVALTSSTSSPTYGSPLTLTAKVSGSGLPATGSVSFFAGSTLLGTGTLSSGVATMVTTALPVGTSSIHASYGGDTNFLTAQSTILTETEGKASIVVELSATPNPVSDGFPLQLTALLPGVTGGATPTGTVKFYADNISLGTFTATAGSAVVTDSQLTGGKHAFIAQYNGDPNYKGSNSSTISATVDKVATTLAVTTSANPVVFGAPVTINVAASFTILGKVVTGTVHFFSGSTLIGTQTLSSGHASFTTSALSGGSDSISVHYLGDANYLAVESPAVTETVQKAAEPVTLTATPATVALNAPITLKVTVATVASGVQAGGTANFYVDNKGLGPANVSNGVATFTISTLAAGKHTFVGQYNGDSNYKGGDSNTASVTVK